MNNQTHLRLLWPSTSPPLGWVSFKTFTNNYINLTTFSDDFEVWVAFNLMSCSSKLASPALVCVCVCVCVYPALVPLKSALVQRRPLYFQVLLSHLFSEGAVQTSYSLTASPTWKWSLYQPLSSHIAAAFASCFAFWVWAVYVTQLVVNI